MAKSSGTVATAYVEILLAPLSKLSKALGAARAMVASGVSAMGRGLVATMARSWSLAVQSVAAAGRKIVAAMTRTWAIVTAGVRRVGSAVTGVMGRMFRIIKRFLPMGGLLGGLGGGYALVRTMSVFANFEQAMARVQAITNASAGQFSKLSAEARRLGETTVFSATEAAEAMGNFAVAGFSINEIMGAIGPTLNLAAAGQLDMATSSDIIAKLMRGMGLEAKELTRAVDVMTNAFTTSNTDIVELGAAFGAMGPVGKSAGKDMDELTAAIQIMSDSAIGGQKAGTALRNIMMRMQGGTSEVKKAFNKLNFSIADANGNMKHMSVIIDELNAKTSKMTRIERNAIIGRIAGVKAAAALNTLLEAGGDVYREKEKALSKSGTAERVAAIQVNTLMGSYIILKSAIQEASISFGQAMAPAVRSVITALQSFVVVLGKVLESVKPVVSWIAGNLVQGIKSASTWLKSSMATFRLWGEQVKQIMSNVASAYANAWGWLFKLIHVDVSTVMGGISGVLEAMAAITTSPGLVFDSLIYLLKAAFHYGAEILVIALRSWFSAMIANFTTPMLFLISNWRGLFSVAWKTLKNVFTWAFDMIMSVGQWLIAKAVVGFKGILATAAEVELVRGAALDIELKKRQPDTWTDLGKAFGDTWMTSFKTVNEAIKKNITGNFEKKMAARGQFWASAAKYGWEQAKERGAAGRPEVRTPWMDMWGGIGAGMPGMVAAAMEQARKVNIWDLFIAGPGRKRWVSPGRVNLMARRASAAAAWEAEKERKRALFAAKGKPLTDQALAAMDDTKKKREGVGQMSDLVGYLTSLQSSLGKQDKQDDIATATEDTAENTGEDGPIVQVLRKIEGKKTVAGFA